MAIHVKPGVLAFSLLLSISAAQAQNQLTDDQYFKNNFKGIVNAVPAYKWIDDSKVQYVVDGKTMVANAQTGEISELKDSDKKITPVQVAPSAYTKGKDLYIKLEGTEVQLTNDEAKEVNATMSPDGNYVAYTKNNDLYTVDIRTKTEKRLTQDGSEVILNGYSSWVYMEEILGRRTQYRAFWWSPDSKQLAFFRSDDTKVPIYTITDANDQHGYIEKVRYPKVGDPNPEVKIGIVHPNGGNIVWADFNATDDQYFGHPYWKPSSSGLLVQWMNRKQNQLKIWDINPLDGSKKLFLEEEQKTWVDLDDDEERIRFLQNGKGFIYTSDQSGYRHIYLYDMNGKLLNPITNGKFTVTDIYHIDEAKGTVYFSARKENTARKDFYRVNMNGKKFQRLSFGDFNHYAITLSPKTDYFITAYNNSSNPTKIAIVNNKGKVVKELYDARGSQYATTALAKTEIIRVMSDDSLYALPMKITWPANMEKGKKYPVLIAVYGGPNAGTVMDSWGLSGNQQWYAKEGLIQVAMDHRASGHFGKEGVNYMYHNLGYWEMKDYTAMVKWLIANAQADPAKICITGFSYGGYMSCYALTYAADVFTHGMAGGSVVDWTLYDTHYTERFMGTQSDNAEGYKSSSVLTHADKYKGMLQIVHGVIDENVHMQNSIQLISKLQDQKKDFEFMIYSGGRHGWGGSKGMHFQNLKTKFIYKYLLEKDVPKGLLR